MAENVEIMTDENYESLISDGTLIVDVWADWCGPCKRTTPVFEKMAAQNKESDVTFAKLDAQNNQSAASHFKITSLPSFLIFSDGELQDRWAGAHVQKLRQKIEDLVD